MRFLTNHATLENHADQCRDGISSFHQQQNCGWSEVVADETVLALSGASKRTRSTSEALERRLNARLGAQCTDTLVAQVH